MNEEIILFVCRVIRDTYFADTITFECPKNYESNFLLRFYHTINDSKSNITAEDIYCRRYTDVGWRYDIVRYEINCLQTDKTAIILERVMAYGITKEKLPIAIIALLVDESSLANQPVKKDGFRLIKRLENIVWEATFELTADIDRAMVYAEINEFAFRQSEKGRVQNGKF